MSDGLGDKSISAGWLNLVAPLNTRDAMLKDGLAIRPTVFLQPPVG
jgi:hypothetical protein